MKIVMGIRSDYSAVPGGDVVQMEKTRVELGKLGCDVIVRAGEIGDLVDADLVHVFNTTRIDDTYRMVTQAQRAERPVVVSTIWHSMAEMARAYGNIYGIRPVPVWSYPAGKEIYYAYRAGRKWNLNTALAYRSRVKYVIEKSDGLLPNSSAELAALTRETGCTPRRSFIIPNGYDVQPASMVTWSSRNDVVCAGRIEPRKNQVKLARAFLKAKLPEQARMYFYGASLPQVRSYMKKLEHKLIPGKIEYGGRLPQSELYAKYGQARVTVLASYFETTGLSVLEGLACGSSVVILDSPCTREYFGEAVQYCDPYSETSIAAAIRRAWETPPLDNTNLLRRFTWSEAGRLTLSAYEKVISAYHKRG